MSPAYPSTCTFTSTLIACPLGTQPYPRRRLQAEPPHQEGLPWINVTGWSISDQKGPQRTQQYWKSTARNAPLALSISLGLRTHIFSDLLILPHAGCCSWPLSITHGPPHCIPMSAVCLPPAQWVPPKHGGRTGHYCFASFYFLKIAFVYLAMLGLCCCLGFSLVSASEGHSLGVVHGLLTVGLLLLWSIWVSVVAAHELSVVAHRISCSAACGILLDQVLNPCLLHWQADSLPLNHQGSPHFTFNFKISASSHQLTLEVERDPVQFNYFSTVRPWTSLSALMASLESSYPQRV